MLFNALSLSLAAIAPAVPPAVNINQLSVSCDASKQLSGASVTAAAILLQRHGCVLLKNALNPAVVDEAAETVSNSYARCQAALEARGLKPLDPFAFAEIAHRSKLRYDMQMAEAAPSLPSALMRTAPWRPLLHRVLGDDCADLFQGAVIAEPGAADQQPHMDGGHLFQATHEYEQAQNPCHCLNIFVPLVDVTEELGPTEFWPGSHVLDQSRMAFAGASPSVSLAGQKGDAIIFDYRVVHRGRENVGSIRRPVLYLTHSRSWFRDAQNFPDERLLEGAAAAKGGAAGARGGFGGGKAAGGAKGKAKGSGGKKRR